MTTLSSMSSLERRAATQPALSVRPVPPVLPVPTVRPARPARWVYRLLALRVVGPAASGRRSVRDPAPGRASAPLFGPRSRLRTPFRPALESRADARGRILDELRSCEGRLCLDAVLRHAGWGMTGPALGEYACVMRDLADQLKADGEAWLERTWETGWTLHVLDVSQTLSTRASVAAPAGGRSR